MSTYSVVNSNVFADCSVSAIDNYIDKNEVQTLTANDPCDNAYFGYSIDISTDGNIIVVGAVQAVNSGYTNAGQAYVFTRSGNTWTQHQILSASDVSDYADFGYNVATNEDGNILAVGAPVSAVNDYNAAGQVYIFTRSGDVWIERQILSASDASVNAYFGYNIGISSDGDTVVVGAKNQHVSGYTTTGQVYIFTRSGDVWIERQILTASDMSNYAGFGTNLSISNDGNIIIIGAPGANSDGYTAAGQAYVFIKSGDVWIERQILSASDAINYAYFGYSVDTNADGSVIIIGAALHTNGEYRKSGQAYVFIKSGNVWIQQQILAASDMSANANFGTDVATSADGNMMLIGSPGSAIDGLTSAGQVYVFARSGNIWTERQILSARDVSANANFGVSVVSDSNSNTLVTGATLSDNGEYNGAGSVHVFN